MHSGDDFAATRKRQNTSKYQSNSKKKTRSRRPREFTDLRL